MADPCVQLAQRLAGNDKKSRDRALRRLRAYLRERSREGEFSGDELCKIWKGLFYCMWMQDKPLLQEELAQNMAMLVHHLQTRQTRNLFLRSFWQTLNREWNGIDRLRLDKFYMLIRFVFHQSAQLVKLANWEESMVEEFLGVLVEEVLKTEAPRGVQHHLIDIYLEELGKVGSVELTAETNLRLIAPFCKIAAKTKDSVLLQSVVNGIFQMILDQAPFAIEDLMKEVGHEATDDDAAGDGVSGPGGPLSRDGEDVGPVLQFDYQAVSERLFHLASRHNIPPRNRKSLYRLVKRFKDLAEGIFPHDDLPEEVSTDEDDDEFSSWRFRKRQKKFQERLMMETQGFIDKPEKKRRASAAGSASSAEPLEEESGKEGGAKRKRKKKKVSHPEREAEPPQLNGRAESLPTQAAQPRDSAPSAKATVKRRRSRLLRLSLSVLPLRGALLMRRRRALGRRRMIGKPETSSVAPPAAQSSVAPPAARPSVAPPAARPSVAPPAAQSSVAPPAAQPSVAPPAAQPSVAPPAAQPSVAPPAAAVQDFVNFCKLETPKPLYVKSRKGGGRQIQQNHKKVTFSLKKNTTAEFRRTDRSLLVSPAGSSRIPFNPEQRPQHSVLKTPSPVSRARASDFF